MAHRRAPLQGPAGPAFGPTAAGLGTGTTQAAATAPKTAPKAQQGGGGYGGGMGGPQGPYVDQVADMEDDEVAVIVVAETEEICDEALRALNP